MTSPIITVGSLSKKYRIGACELRGRTFREAVVDAFASPARNFRRLRRLTRFDEREPSGTNGSAGSSAAPPGDIIWALKDVSFTVQPGEVVGIIGRNGAGKSTLLKILSRITEPTSGEAKLYGRVSSLLEVGTGFHPELTGRENIYLNGTILGMRKTEIDRKFDEIVAFSEIEKFLDTPVKRYSSGMYVRLAFAVAAHLEPEILLVDEVLAVGDVSFQKKCLGKMGAVAREGRTVLFVSHNLAAIQHLCPVGLVLDEGRTITYGPIGECLESYLSLSPEPLAPARESQPLYEKKRAVITDIVLEKDRHRTSVLLCCSSAVFIVNYTVHNRIANPYIRLTIYNSHGLAVAGIATEDTGFAPSPEVGSHSLSCKISSLNLVPGSYYLNVSISDDNGECDKKYNTCSFSVEEADIYGTGKFLTSRTGIITLKHSWQ